MKNFIKNLFASEAPKIEAVVVEEVEDEPLFIGKPLHVMPLSTNSPDARLEARKIRVCAALATLTQDDEQWYSFRRELIIIKAQLGEDM